MRGRRRSGPSPQLIEGCRPSFFLPHPLHDTPCVIVMRYAVILWGFSLFLLEIAAPSLHITCIMSNSYGLCPKSHCLTDTFLLSEISMTLTFLHVRLVIVI